jgi:hypothetical protein
MSLDDDERWEYSFFFEYILDRRDSLQSSYQYSLSMVRDVLELPGNIEVTVSVAPSKTGPALPNPSSGFHRRRSREHQLNRRMGVPYL